MKKRNRRLTLNRETIRNLDANHLHNVVGGAFTDLAGCDTHGPETGAETLCDDTTPGGSTIVGCATASVVCPTTGATHHTN